MQNIVLQQGFRMNNFNSTFQLFFKGLRKIKKVLKIRLKKITFISLKNLFLSSNHRCIFFRYNDFQNRVTTPQPRPLF